MTTDSLIQLLKLIEKGAVLSIRRSNGSFSLEIEHGMEFVAIEINRKQFEEHHLVQALSRLAEVAQNKMEL